MATKGAAPGTPWTWPRACDDHRHRSATGTEIGADTQLSPFSRILDNGLQVLALECRTAPVASLWVWYRVGVRNEYPGITGISHWVEHMLFKGTERWSAGAADQAIARVGGIFNGLTWYDFTTFYETLAVDQLALALDIESDRMRGTTFTPEAVTAERTVVISERQGHENSPSFLLSEEVNAAAFRVHPYGHETIGHLCDLLAITRDDLQRHHDTYYTPNNAVVAVAGDVQHPEVTERIAEAFGDIPSGPTVPEVRAVEPSQRGPRRVVVHGAGETDYVEIVYHVPPATHPDFHPLTVLNAILAGGSGFLVGRGHITNHTSRLYGTLVDREYAVDIHGSLAPTLDPGLYRLSATVWPGQRQEALEEAVDNQLERLQETLVSAAELTKAQQQARAMFAYASESISNQAFWLGFSNIFADDVWFSTYLESIAAVTPEDICRVAQTYLVPNNRTTGWYVGDGKTD